MLQNCCFPTAKVLSLSHISGNIYVHGVGDLDFDEHVNNTSWHQVEYETKSEGSWIWINI